MTDEQAEEAEQKELEKLDSSKKEFLDWCTLCEPIAQLIDSMFV